MKYNNNILILKTGEEQENMQSFKKWEQAVKDIKPLHSYRMKGSSLRNTIWAKIKQQNDLRLSGPSGGTGHSLYSSQKNQNNPMINLKKIEFGFDIEQFEMLFGNHMNMSRGSSASVLSVFTGNDGSMLELINRPSVTKLINDDNNAATVPSRVT